MEIEHIIYEHQAAALCHGREESVQYPSCHEGVERLCAGTPCRCRKRHDKKPEQQRKTTEVGGQCYNEYSTCTEHEDVANLGVVYFIF